MSGIIWPESLPQKISKDGYQELLPDSRIRSPVSMGPVKVRRRFTAQVRPVKIEMPLTADQAEALDTFFRITTHSGALPFLFPNPRGAGTVSARFGEAPPEFGDFEGLRCIAAFELEILP